MSIVMEMDWISIVENIVSKECLKNLKKKERLELKERKYFLKNMNKYKWEPVQEFRNQIFTSNLTSIFDLINAITKKCILCNYLSCKRSNNFKVVCSEYGPPKNTVGCESFLLNVCWVNCLIDSHMHELDKRLRFHDERKQEMLLMNKHSN